MPCATRIRSLDGRAAQEELQGVVNGCPSLPGGLRRPIGDTQHSRLRLPDVHSLQQVGRCQPPLGDLLYLPSLQIRTRTGIDKGVDARQGLISAQRAVMPGPPDMRLVQVDPPVSPKNVLEHHLLGLACPLPHGGALALLRLSRGVNIGRRLSVGYSRANHLARLFVGGRGFTCLCSLGRICLRHCIPLLAPAIVHHFSQN